MPVKIFVGDDLPTLEFTVIDEDGAVVDLSAKGLTAAKCFIREEDATTNKFSGGDVTATIIDAANGRIDWTMPSGGIDTAGRYTGQLELTFGAAGDQQTERFQFFVEQGVAA